MKKILNMLKSIDLAWFALQIFLNIEMDQMDLKHSYI